MKLSTKLLLSALLCTGLAACQGTDGANKTAKIDPVKRDAVLEICTIDDKTCACMADQIAQNLTDKEWTIFSAMVNNAAEPPAGTTQEDMTVLSNKLQSVDQACGLQPQQ